MSVIALIQTAASDMRVATTTAATTTATGVGTLLEWIPTDIGKLATVIGLILSVVLIRVHLANLKKINFELEVMRRKEEERQRENDSSRRRRDD